jgi:hypothetical protein
LRVMVAVSRVVLMVGVSTEMQNNHKTATPKNAELASHFYNLQPIDF